MAKKLSGKSPTYRVFDDPQRPGKKLVHLSLGHGKFVRRRATSAEAAERIGQELVERYEQKLNVKSGTMTFQAFVNVWWSKAVQPRNLAPKTKADYRTTIERYVLPTWGNYRLDEFDATTIIDLFYAVREAFSEATAHRVLNKLHMVFDAARRWKYIRDNPVADARKDLPAMQHAEKQALTVKQIQHLLIIVAGHRWNDIYYVMLTLGLRIGETLGLQWQDFDWEANTVTIKRQAQELNGKISVREATKTKAGKRTLPIPTVLRGRLHARYEKRGETLFVFTSNKGKMVAPPSFWRHWRGQKAGKRRADGTHRTIVGMRQHADLPDWVTPHIFRHTVATRLKELGVSREIRADILGHDQDNITESYSHVTLRPMHEALEKLEKLIHGI